MNGISVTNYSLRTAGFTEENLKSILSYSVGFNPRSVEMKIAPEDYTKISLEEKRMTAFMPPVSSDVDNLTSTENIKYITGQLDSWAGSGSSGNAMAERAAVLIRALEEKINKLEGKE